MIRLILITLGFLFGATAAQAQVQPQTVYRYDAQTIDASIKCELGQVAKLLGPPKAGWPKMQAVVNVAGTETTTRKVGGGLGFFANVGGSYEVTQGRTRAAKGTRNIHVDNSVNCRKSFVVDVGVLSCFREQKDLYLAGQTITCSDSTTASSAANAGGKFDIWVINVNVTGDLTKKREWKVDLSAPPEEK
jgi:hypothetical protein